MHHVPLSEDMVLGPPSMVGQCCTIKILQTTKEVFSGHEGCLNTGEDFWKVPAVPTITRMTRDCFFAWLSKCSPRAIGDKCWLRNPITGLATFHQWR